MPATIEIGREKRYANWQSPVHKQVAREKTALLLQKPVFRFARDAISLLDTEGLSTKREGAEAFRLEYDPHTPAPVLYNDIVSYLGEYRFEIPEYRFTQFYGATALDKKVRFRDVDQGKPMVEIGNDSIKDREKRGESTGKVDADLKGIQEIEALLEKANDGDRIIYASPPDPVYGFTYGYLYDSRIEVIVKDKKRVYKRVHVRALRLDKNPELSQFNKALSEIDKSSYSFATPNAFIENPILITRALSDQDINHVLRQVFHFTVDTRQQAIFKEVIAKMNPYIYDVIQLIKNGTADQEKAFHALENYALKLKAEKEKGSAREEQVIFDNRQRQLPPFGQFLMNYGYQPPKVMGSCGSTGDNGGRNGNDIYGSKSIFGAKGAGESYTGENAKNDPNLCRCAGGDGPHFHCPGNEGACGYAIVVGKDISSCPACGAGKVC